MTVRARLTIWHTGLLLVLVTAFAASSLALLRRVELRRIDSTLHEQSEIVTQAMQAAGAPIPGPDTTTPIRLLAALHDLRARGIRAWTFDGQGRPTSSTGLVQEGEGPAEERMVLGDTLPSEMLANAALVGRHDVSTQTVRTAGGEARLMASPLPAELGAGSIVVSYSLRDLADLLRDARRAAVAAVLIAAAVSSVGGYLLARSSMLPVADMSSQAARIGATNLHERVPVRNARDELGLLATTFNGLLDRVAVVVDQQRRFMADASHELRTPVAILRGETDVALRGTDRSPGVYREALVVVAEASERLSRTVNDIFLLARADASQAPATPIDMYLNDLVTETCRGMRSLAARRDVAVMCEAREEIAYVGDEQLLRRLMMNLVDNAIKYSFNGGVVDVLCAREARQVVLVVSNGGPGIPAEARDHVFERFFRADPSRATPAASGSPGGSGLGLSIARWVAETHGGTLDLTEATETRTTFTLRLPVDPVLRHA